MNKMRMVSPLALLLGRRDDSEDDDGEESTWGKGVTGGRSWSRAG